MTISNNVTFNNGGGIIVGQGDSPNYGRTPADAMTVANNIAIANRVAGITETGANGPHNRYLNNIVFGNGTDRISTKAGTESGTVEADPGFVQYRPDGSGDYRLRVGSPGIDTGTVIGAAPDAIDGIRRPQGRGYDIGAYEG
jgi:hypothetical protein